nr:hypothetical protein [Tanacetum cinerariifolium]
AIERVKLLAELIDNRKKLQAAQRYEAIRIKPQTMSQKNKKAGLNLQEESSKRQKTEKGSESTKEPKANEISQEDLQQMMMIVQVEEVYVEALQRFDRDDLVRLWDLVKERFSTTEPTDDKEKALWVKLKRLFELDNDDILWKLQRVNHKFKRGLFEIKASEISTAEYMHFYYWLKILLLMKIRENNLSQ